MPLTLEEKLAEAEAAYHRLLTGTSARIYVDTNGERVEYTSANIGRLSAYINELRRALGLTPRGSGPIGIVM